MNMCMHQWAVSLDMSVPHSCIMYINGCELNESGQNFLSPCSLHSTFSQLTAGSRSCVTQELGNITTRYCNSSKKNKKPGTVQCTGKSAAVQHKFGARYEFAEQVH